MKSLIKNNLLLLLIVFLALTSCDKSENTIQDEQTTGDTNTDITKINISGTDYPVISIGNQLWTTENYSGLGGTTQLGNQFEFAYYEHRVYTFTDTVDIQLPSGWRVPSKEDYVKLLKTIGSASSWTNKTINSTNYQFFAIEAGVYANLLSKDAWETSGKYNGQSGYNAYPVLKQSSKGYLNTYYMCSGGSIKKLDYVLIGDNCEAGIYSNYDYNNGYIGSDNNENPPLSIRFVKDK